MPNENFDLAFVDIWRDASDGAPIYEKMKTLEHLSPKTEFLYWIESFLISRLRAEKFSKIYDEYESGTLSLTYPEVVEKIKKIP